MLQRRHGYWGDEQAAARGSDEGKRALPKDPEVRHQTIVIRFRQQVSSRADRLVLVRLSAPAIEDDRAKGL